MSRLPQRAFAPLQAMALEASTGPVIVSFEHQELGFSVQVHRPIRDGRCWYTVRNISRVLSPFPVLAMLSNPLEAYQAYPASLEDADALTDLSPVIVLGDIVEDALRAGKGLRGGQRVRDRNGRWLALQPIDFPVRFRPVTVLAVIPK